MAQSLWPGRSCGVGTCSHSVAGGSQRGLANFGAGCGLACQSIGISGYASIRLVRLPVGKFRLRASAIPPNLGRISAVAQCGAPVEAKRAHLCWRAGSPGIGDCGCVRTRGVRIQANIFSCCLVRPPFCSRLPAATESGSGWRRARRVSASGRGIWVRAREKFLENRCRPQYIVVLIEFYLYVVLWRGKSVNTCIFISPAVLRCAWPARRGCKTGNVFRLRLIFLKADSPDTEYKPALAGRRAGIISMNPPP